MKKILSRQNDLGLLILRLGIAVLMLFHGVNKMWNGLDGIRYLLGEAHLPSFLAYGAFVGEVLAPLLILMGYRTRLAAVVLAGNMLMAIGMAHLSQIFEVTATGAWAIELPMLFMIPAIALCFTGGGKYALSHRNMWD